MAPLQTLNVNGNISGSWNTRNGQHVVADQIADGTKRPGWTFASETPQNTLEPIAIVGMGCRLPGGVSKPSDLWELLCEKRTGLREFDDTRMNLPGFYHPNPERPGSFPTRGACLLDEDPRLFDHTFFGINTTQLASMDPNQRKMLEVSYESLESAGEPWNKFAGSKTGVFIGNMGTDHSIMQACDADFAQLHGSTGPSTSILSNRINHVFNLRGPSMTVDTACSSSMYALHLAVNSIRSGECDAAIVGGCNLILSAQMQIMTAKLGTLSPTSTCHTFDASADGYCRGEGFGALYLKRYSDAKNGAYPIRALIRGTAINSNGRTAGISHPSADGQEEVIRQAYKNAGLPTNMTGYFECHGTGTPVGDPVEVSAIGRVFGPERLERKPLLIGSVKSNLGHSEAASGIAGIIKTVLALEKGMIPATVGVQKLNPNVDFERARVQVVTELTPWPLGVPKRASINSFGFGGSNSHCVLDHESLLGVPERDVPVSSPARRLTLLPFSAHGSDSLELNIAATHDVLSQCSLVDTAYTLSARRSKFLYRGFRIVNSEKPAETSGSKTSVTWKPPSKQSCRIAFIFTGQGAQWQGMGVQLMDYPIFRESIQRQDQVLQGISDAPPWLLEDIFAGRSLVPVQAAEVSQTICTALQIALVDLLRSWEIVPHACSGHSSGEIAAAYASGCISAAVAIVTAYCRGRAISKNKQEGLMLAVGLSHASALQSISGFESDVKIAAINSPKSVTLSGDRVPVEKIYEKLKAQEVFARTLRTGGQAYHSHHMNPIGSAYENMLPLALREVDQLDKLDLMKRCPAAIWISSVNPDKLMHSDDPSPTYWCKNLQSPVQFHRAVEKLLGERETSPDVFIEIGPHSVLQSPLKEIFTHVQAEKGIKPPTYISALKRNEDGMRNILELCGTLFCLNATLNLLAVNGLEERKNENIGGTYGSVCTDLPPYKYKYGPPIYHENRIFREIKQRKNLRHDLLGVLLPGCAKDRPTWRNILRLHDLPWLGDHRLLPGVVLPGAAYVALAIEALWQYLDVDSGGAEGCSFQLRNVSIQSAMQIPEDDVGLEIVLDLQKSSHSPNTFQFKVSSVHADPPTWTSHASGHITLKHGVPRPIKRLDERTDFRIIEANDWYEKFADAGLGYGSSFHGISALLCDPLKKIATGKIALNTTKGMFQGPESRYLVHPATLDMSFQLAIIAFHGGQKEKLKTGFVPVFIDEMMVWPTSSSEDWVHGIAQAQSKGLRGGHASIHLFDPSGQAVVEVQNVRSVSYIGPNTGQTSSAQLPSPFTRLIWKPDISSLSNSQARSIFSPTRSVGLEIVAAHSQFERILDLMAHQNPNMKILEVGAGLNGVTEVAMKILGAESESKRYRDYILTNTSSGLLQSTQNKDLTCKRVAYRTLDFNESPLEQGFDQDHDLIIASQSLHTAKNISAALFNIRRLLKQGRRMIMLEATPETLGHDITNGTLPNYSVEDVEKGSPSRSISEWETVLKEAGFSGVDIQLNDYLTPLQLTSTIVTTAVDSTISETGPSHDDTVHIIYRLEEDIHRALASELASSGVKPILSTLEDCEVAKGSRVILATNIGFHSLIHGDEWEFLKTKEVISRASSMLWLTDGDVLRGHNPQAAVVTGLVRMLTSEDSLSKYGVFHLEQDNNHHNPEAVRLIVQREAKIHRGDLEREIAMYNGVEHIGRLLVDDDLVRRHREIHSSNPTIIELPLHKHGPVRVDFETPGIISSLYFRPDENLKLPLPDSWIEVRTGAIGLNWKDLAASSGKLDINYFSCEFSGTVVDCGEKVTAFRPGDRVYGLALRKYGNFLRLPAMHARLMAPKDKFVSMASTPVAFCTAFYALHHLAHVQKGERVLIQTATGGLGLAAIQLARLMEAEIFATTSSEEKVSYLVQNHNIPQDRIFSSRSSSDMSKMMEATQHKGFDVILSTSNGDLMHDSWRCVARRGRFIDVGRVDVQNHGNILMEVFERNATFSSFDLAKIVLEEPEFAGRLMHEVDTMMKDGSIGPIPGITFNISELDKALLYLSRGKHIGKVVVSYEDDGSVVKMQTPLPRANFDHQAVYVLVGGLGALGRSIIPWMVGHGARNLAIFSRSGVPPAEALTLIEDLSERKVSVWLFKCDVTDKDQVKQAMYAATDHGPIRGILHSAVVLEDLLFESLSYAKWKHGLSVKVNGTLNLHNIAGEMNLCLDFFVMTSSFEAIVALPTQAAYCASNCFQDAFARYRRSKGLPACAIAFGLITEIGEMGQRDITRKLMYRNGLYRTGELSFLRLLESAFLEGPRPTSAAWPSFDPLAEAQITACLDPAELAKMAGKEYDAENHAPRWHSDTKFSHLLRSMNDKLIGEKHTKKPESTIIAVTEKVEKAIRTNSVEEAVLIVGSAIMERTVALLFLPQENMEMDKSLAEYGMDSLIAVEVRNFLVHLFGDTIPLLKLLDESVSIRALAEMIVEKRRTALES